ncbi:DUF4331 domain-containing protein [Streptomyces sp. SL13]|uniref:DUF4331 domain-containing protein n=1 Tax=Streptantibioticus silvisoli TaxID=2705255 RepID=A0AA90KC28_9ACTN|nr:DUF4331 domain-containing protein [Streptantibioticus silvisoli]MDI5974443.1 DUF4331 domain-containing protein [Streptantibioticus silvisoli]
MSSHREAPEISKDPVADSTDVYAFVSPDAPDTVTLIANYIPLQNPAGGPNFYEFGDDVLYEIHIDNDGDGRADVSYQFRFTTRMRTPGSFLYNTGPIRTLDSRNWNRYQTYRLTRVDYDGRRTELGRDLTSPPCNIGPLSTPDYPALARQAVHPVGRGRKVFAGQRAEGFYVDLGAIFDLGDLRPFQNLHNQYGMSVFTQPAPGVNTTKELNVHTLALQVPISELTRDGRRSRDAMDPRATIGVWTTASRRQARIIQDGRGEDSEHGPFVQVSRLGNPLFNEVLVPLGEKDHWNALPPSDDKRFATYVAHPELAALLPGLYPGVFPHLDAYNRSGKSRADLLAILLTGIPKGVVPGFQNNTGTTQADMLRLNTAIPPTGSPNILGLIGGDPAGFPNGRRVFDDVVTVELRAIAGATLPLVDPTFTPDAAANAVTDGLTPADVTNPYLTTFPYLGVPYDGYHYPPN